MPLSPSQSAQIPLIAPISSLLKPASVCLGGPEFPQLVRTARSSKKPRRPSQRVRELGNCQVAPVLKLHRLCGKSSAESYEPFRYKCSCLVSLSLDSLESWAFAHFSTAYYCFVAQRSWNTACQCRPCQCEGPSSRFCLFFLDKSWQKIVQFFVVLRGNK